MEEDDPLQPPRTRRPRAKSGTRAVGAKSTASRSKRAPAPDEGAATAATASSSRSGSNGNPEPPPQFDHLVADDGFVRDFDRMTSSNPKSAVLTALAVGVALGFFAALILSRD